MTRLIVLAAFLLGAIVVWFGFKIGASYTLALFSRFFPG